MNNNEYSIDRLLGIDNQLCAQMEHLRLDQEAGQKAFTHLLGKLKLSLHSWPEDFNLSPIK
jgi:hypothetical protein